MYNNSVSNSSLALSVLKEKKLFVLDMDGTFYLGNRILPGSLDFITKLREIGKDFLFFTNNSSKTSDFYVNKLGKMGCDITGKNILTSGDVTIKYIKDHYPSKLVYLAGTELLTKSFSKAGIKLIGNSYESQSPRQVEDTAGSVDPAILKNQVQVDQEPDLVVIGFDMTLTYEKVVKACKFIRNGATFLATHPDLNCPTEDGPIPDCGSFCAMITASTGVKPRYLGKPYKETLESIVSITGRKKEEIVFIGDRLYTDIAIGSNNVITTILVLSGETRLSDLEVSDMKPDLIFNSIGEISSYL